MKVFQQGVSLVSTVLPLAMSKINSGVRAMQLPHCTVSETLFLFNMSHIYALLLKYSNPSAMSTTYFAIGSSLQQCFYFGDISRHIEHQLTQSKQKTHQPCKSSTTDVRQVYNFTRKLYVPGIHFSYREQEAPCSAYHG